MTKASRWATLISLVAATGTGLVLAFLLAVATNNRIFYERNFAWLFWVNVAVAVLLLLVIGVAAVRLYLRVARGKFGSRLLLKLAAYFALVGVMPGVLIYTVSFQFVSRSIESWFDLKVEKALDAGLALALSTLDAQVNQLADKARNAAERMGETRGMPQALALERLREQLGVVDIAIIGPNGQPLVTAGSFATSLAPDWVSQRRLRQVRGAKVISQIEGLEDDAAVGSAGPAAPAAASRIHALAFIPNTEIELSRQDSFLYISQLVPAELALNALSVQSAYREYQQRSLARAGLRKMYIGTLTLALILAIFGALLLAVTVSRQLAQPLLLLAEGMRQVARGDLSSKPVFASRDELGGLTRSFAEMTQQLSDARALAQQSVSQVEGARTNLQTILDNLTAGVIVFDRDGRIDTVNPGATRILRLPLSAYQRRRLDEVPGLETLAQAVSQRFELHTSSPEAGERDQWQDSFVLQPPTPAAEREPLTLLVRGAVLPMGARLMVFDDISAVVSAQRSEAWAEVARRLAHEIKNPLTPIQLSAERLQHKLEVKLEGADRSMLVRCVGTIVNQVQAMKTLVNEFRDYARLPAARMTSLDLNELVSEVLGLYGTAQEAGQLCAELGKDLPPIEGDATQLRQVIHNLVQNALDAVAQQEDGRVVVRTEASRTDQGELRAVRLDISDNGPGFPDKVLKRAFEPYVTTKTKGTGLGLAVVKKIADEHGARVRIANFAPLLTDNSDSNLLPDGASSVRGAQVSLSFSKISQLQSVGVVVDSFEPRSQ